MSQPTVLIATPDPLPPLPALSEITEESLAAWQQAVYAQAAQAAVGYVHAMLDAELQEAPAS